MLSPDEIGCIAISYFEKLGFAADFSVCDNSYCQINYNVNGDEDWIKMRSFTSAFSVVRSIKTTLKTKGAN